MPLVPRHGARILRGRRHGAAHERAVRLRQGRPRGASRRRRPLHGCRRRDDGARRLADDGLPHAGRPALLRRHVLPAGAAARPAELRAGAAGSRRGLQDAPPRARAAGGHARRRDQAGQRAAPLGRAADKQPPERRRAGPPAELRPAGGWVRACAEVPGRLDDRAAPAPACRGRRRGRARHGAADARPHGRRRHVRPARRRLPPLLRGRALARPPLREDALRQRAARLRLPPRLGRHRRGAVPAGVRSRRSTTSCGSCGSPRVASPRRRTRTRTASRVSPSRGRQRRSRPLSASRTPSGSSPSSTDARSSGRRSRRRRERRSWPRAS